MYSRGRASGRSWRLGWRRPGPGGHVVAAAAALQVGRGCDACLGNCIAAGSNVTLNTQLVVGPNGLD